MRRVVITGMGLVSCLGNTKESVTKSLSDGKSGISFNEGFRELGLRSQVCGSVDIDLADHIDRKHLRFMGDAAAYAYIAMQNAIDDAGLSDELVSNVRTGLIAGSGGASSANIVLAADKLRDKGVRRLGALRGSENHEQHCFSLPCHAFWNSWSQLFGDVRLCYKHALHRFRHGADPME